MSEFTERQNAFIDGLVQVLEASEAAYQAEQGATDAMESNLKDMDALREEQAVELDDVERYLDEAVARSRFTEDDNVVQATRDGMLLARALGDALNEQGLTAANSHLPVL